MRYPSIFTGSRDQLGTQMLTPLIDVVFLLLVFFLWTASFQVAEEILPSQLTAVRGTTEPARQLTPEMDFDDVIISIRPLAVTPRWQINESPVASLGQLRERLDRIAGVKQDAPVVIDAAAEVALGDVIDVYDLARLAGFQKIQFAASEEI